MEPNFPDHTVSPPDLEDTRLRYEAMLARIAGAESPSECMEVLEDWDELLRRLKEWNSMTQIRFHQDTKNPDYVAAKEHLDADWPKFFDLETQMKKALMDTPHRDSIVEKIGPQAFDLWRCNIATFDPAVEDDLANEAKLGSEYTALTACGNVEFRGEKLTLSELERYFQDPDREVRHEACLKNSDWYFENREQLDRIYDDQVRLRDTIAQKLGNETFVDVGYKRMPRIGYGPAEVAAFREEVVREVVPLANDLAEKQAERLGVDPLMLWDDGVFSPEGNPTPLGDHDWMVERAAEMFSAMGHGLDTFFGEVRSRNLMDLKSREGKAGGGFCDYLHEFRWPFIFANFNGTRHDVDVFTHEIGHAFQSWSSSRNVPISDLVWPTTEAAEIHSMSLEFLTWPHLDLFYGEDGAAEIRRAHLMGYMFFLPYGVAVDHYQHLVYENPDASPEERNGFWRQMEETYLPWWRFGDLPAESSGRCWQMKRHIYEVPFYYIDYTLALTGALQFWRWFRDSPDDAMKAYVDLCKLGGSRPFAELLESAGLKSPFSVGCLKEVVDEARSFLN